MQSLNKLSHCAGSRKFLISDLVQLRTSRWRSVSTRILKNKLESVRNRKTKDSANFPQVCEGPPLRLWKTTIEISATPEDVLNRLLKEQHLWDEDLIESKVIEPLDSQTDIYQYVQNSMAPHPARDFVVLR